MSAGGIMMRCPHCKFETPEFSIFCCHCGERLKKLKRERTIAVPVPKPQRLPSGSWTAQLMTDGKRVRVTADSEAEYYAKARAIKTGLIEQKAAGPSMTVGAAVDAYIESKSRVLSPSTIRGYKSLRKHRFSDLMRRNLAGRIDWQRAVNEELADVGPKTVKNAWRLITGALQQQGVEAPAVTLPRVVRDERPWLDFEQIGQFLEAVRGEPCELAALLALHGLRLSEVLALTPDKIDLANGIIRVEGAAVLDADGILTRKAANKTGSSRRAVHIVIPRLVELLQAAGTGTGKAAPLVVQREKRLYDEINKVCKRAGLPLVGVHGLRHSFASLAYHLGWSEASTMREGGWSNSDTVHRIYTHLAEADAGEDVERMRAFFGWQDPEEDAPPEGTEEGTETGGITQ